MPNFVRFDEVFEFENTAFVYDEERPTYHTERLSYAVYKLCGQIATNGGGLWVEENDNASQVQAVGEYTSNFKLWIDEVSASLAAYMTAEEGSRPILAIPLAPAVPAILAGAVVLYKGAVTTMAINAITTVVRTASQVRADLRQTEVPRILDKALFDSSFFGLSKEAKLDRLITSIDQLSGSFSAYTDNGLENLPQILDRALNVTKELPDNETRVDSITKVIDALVSKPEAIKLLLHAVITSQGNIDEVDFTTNDEV